MSRNCQTLPAIPRLRTKANWKRSRWLGTRKSRIVRKADLLLWRVASQRQCSKSLQLRDKPVYRHSYPEPTKGPRTLGGLFSLYRPTEKGTAGCRALNFSPNFDLAD